MNAHHQTSGRQSHRIQLLKLVTVAVIFSVVCVSIVRAQPGMVLDPESFNFQLPHGVGSSGVLNVANSGDSLLLVTAGQQWAQRDYVVRLLIWTRYTDEDWELQNLLTSLTALEPDYRYVLYDGVDSDEMFNLLEQCHVLIIPDQENANVDTVGAIGEAFRDVIQWFVVERGGFVVGSDCSGQTAAFLRSAGLIDIEIEDDNVRLECEAVDVHPLNAGVSTYTAMPCSNTHFCEDDGAFAVTRPVETDGNNITARRIGDGGVVYLGMDWVQYNAEMTQLLINAVMWHRGGANWLFLEPFEGIIEPNSSEDLFFTIESRIVPTPGEYSQFIVLNSNDPEAEEALVSVEMTVTDWLPAEVSVMPLEIFLIAEPDRDSTLVLLVRNTGGGLLQANLSLADPNVEWLTLSRHVLNVNPGVMDRILLEFHGDAAGNRVCENIITITYENPDPIVVEIPVLYYVGEDFGTVTGTVTDAESNQSVTQAGINLFGLTTFTDDDGTFILNRVPPFLYNLKISHPNYLETTIRDVRVSTNQETPIEAQLYYCLLESDLNGRLEVTLPPNGSERIDGEFQNTGNGILAYESRLAETIELPYLNPWQVRLNVNSSDVTGASEIKGAIFDGEYLLLSAYRGQAEPRKIYFLDHEGTLADSIDQPGEYARGMSDLAWDGELMYGTDWNVILGFDRNGEVQTTIERPPFYYCRAIAWDERDQLFWVADARSDIVAINRDGQEIFRHDNPGLFIYGMGWLDYAEDDYNLYLFSRDGPNNAQVSRLNVETGDIQPVLDLLSNADERAGGFAITRDWDQRHFSAIAQFTGGENRTVIYNLGKQQDWVRLVPSTGSIPPGRSLQVAVNFDARGFHLGDLVEGYLIVNGHQRGGEDTLFATMRIEVNAAPSDDKPVLMPDVYSLFLSPNPFNDQLRIDYRTPVGEVTRIALFDLQGRLVEELIGEVGSGSYNTFTFSAEGLCSGLYFVKMQAGSESRVRQVVLLR